MSSAVTTETIVLLCRLDDTCEGARFSCYTFDKYSNLIREVLLPPVDVGLDVLAGGGGGGAAGGREDLLRSAILSQMSSTPSCSSVTRRGESESAFLA